MSAIMKKLRKDATPGSPAAQTNLMEAVANAKSELSAENAAADNTWASQESAATTDESARLAARQANEQQADLTKQAQAAASQARHVMQRDSATTSKSFQTGTGRILGLLSKLSKGDGPPASARLLQEALGDDFALPTAPRKVSRHRVTEPEQP